MVGRLSNLDYWVSAHKFCTTTLIRPVITREANFRMTRLFPGLVLCNIYKNEADFFSRMTHICAANGPQDETIGDLQASCCHRSLVTCEATASINGHVAHYSSLHFFTDSYRICFPPKYSKRHHLHYRNGRSLTTVVNQLFVAAIDDTIAGTSN
jgi:hypothetical protein